LGKRFQREHAISIGEGWKGHPTFLLFHAMLGIKPMPKIIISLVSVRAEGEEGTELTLSVRDSPECQVRLTTLFPRLAHISLISGPLDSKPSANERKLNFR
jgi:hypothetical protein